MAAKLDRYQTSSLSLSCDKKWQKGLIILDSQFMQMLKNFAGPLKF